MLQTLPAELIYRIADEIRFCLSERKYIPRGKFVCDRAESLSSLSLICRRLRVIFVPLLFESISCKIDPSFTSTKPYISPNITAHVRKLSLDFYDPWHSKTSEGPVDYTCHLLNTFSAVETVQVNDALVALAPRVLEITNSHTSLVRLSLGRIEVHNREREYMQTLLESIPSGKTYGKIFISSLRMVISPALYGGEIPQEMYTMALEVCRKIWDLGIAVDAMQMFSDELPSYPPRVPQVDRNFMQLFKSNFQNLTTMSCEYPLDVEENSVLRSFFARHLALLHLNLQLSGLARRDTFQLDRSPHLRALLGGTKDTVDLLEIMLHRPSAAHPFRLHGVSLSFNNNITTPLIQRKTLSHISQAYTDLDTLKVRVLKLPRGTGAIQVKDMFSAFNSIFKREEFLKLANLDIYWERLYDGDNDDVSTIAFGDKKHSEILIAGIRALSLFIAKSYPSMTRICHYVLHESDYVGNNYTFESWVVRGPEVGLDFQPVLIQPTEGYEVTGFILSD